MLYSHYLANRKKWERFVNQTFGDSAYLVNISRYSDNYRVYQLRNKIIKIRKVSKVHYPRQNDLHGEYKLIQLLTNIFGLDNDPKYIHDDGWEVLSYDSIRGETLENVLPEKNFIEKIFLLYKVFIQILKFNIHGISHCDLELSNVIITEDNGVHLIDFDQAVKTSSLKALLRDMLGRDFDDVRGYGHFGRIIKSAFPRLSGVAGFFRRFMAKDGNKEQVLMVHQLHRGEGDEELGKLENAWNFGKQSNANWPGASVAYYSLTINGHHFPGERSWALRWEPISERVNFTDKRVVEMGCNLGLFSTFARLSGADYCLGLDHDDRILEGARLVSEAFGVKNDYEVVDFDEDNEWEKRYGGFDIVIALSVLNWIKKKDKFLKFLAQHNELLYEGHDSFDTEFERLRSVGFKKIEVITKSERGRYVFYARKNKA